MSWTRGLLALLAVCVLLTGSVSCGADGAQKNKDGQSVSPVGKVLDDTDHEGRHYREVDKGNAPDVGIVVQPDTDDDSWSVRLTVENFTFSPAATKAKAISGHGVAVLFVDDRPVTTLRAPSYHLAAAYVPQGTHTVTARLYADDGTVWAVDGAPVESTADVTASEPQPTRGGALESGVRGSAGGGSGARFVTRRGSGGGASGTRLAARAPGSQPVTAADGGVAVAQAGMRADGGAVSGAGLLSSAEGGDRSLQAGSGGGGAVSRSGPAVSAGGSVPWTGGPAASKVQPAASLGGDR